VDPIDPADELLLVWKKVDMDGNESLDREEIGHLLQIMGRASDGNIVFASS
jgi:hypothetical protein